MGKTSIWRFISQCLDDGLVPFEALPLAIGRFSDPPTPADLHNLSLDERDLEAIRECTPGDCGLKLSAPEIEALKSAAESGGSGWHEAVQQEFRRLVVARVNLYRTARSSIC